MKYDNPELGVSFTIPDKITVGEQLEYFSAREFTEPEERLIRLWDASKVLIADWQCKLIPDMDELKLESTDPQITKIVLWVIARSSNHMAGILSIPKG